MNEHLTAIEFALLEFSGGLHHWHRLRLVFFFDGTNAIDILHELEMENGARLPNK